ncbi:MAG: hypothetical protein K9I36_07470 [Bacteroidia bacterium]|nr:hypothetical protein [Bacteroidia bacterium]
MVSFSACKKTYTFPQSQTKNSIIVCDKVNGIVNLGPKLYSVNYLFYDTIKKTNDGPYKQYYNWSENIYRGSNHSYPKYFTREDIIYDTCKNKLLSISELWSDTWSRGGVNWMNTFEYEEERLSKINYYKPNANMVLELTQTYIPIYQNLALIGIYYDEPSHSITRVDSLQYNSQGDIIRHVSGTDITIYQYDTTLLNPYTTFPKYQTYFADISSIHCYSRSSLFRDNKLIFQNELIHSSKTFSNFADTLVYLQSQMDTSFNKSVFQTTKSFGYKY